MGRESKKSGVSTMRRIALGLLAGTSILGLASIASAADLGVRKALPPPPVWSWTGFYLGVHVGAGWGSAEWDIVQINDAGGAVLEPGTVIPFASHRLNGFLGGLQAGFNWQAGLVVFGAEVQASWADIDGDGPCLEPDENIGLLSCRTQTDWLLTFAGRLGLAIDRALVYLKGGVAWGNSEHSATRSVEEVIRTLGPVDEDRWGVMLGAGVEYAFAPSWTAKVENNFIDFDNELVTFPVREEGAGIGLNVVADVRHHVHVVKFGVNYLFGFAGPVGPVGARY
jgi:outer membrane immunogenic protein